jgi:hypothetical protein
MVLTSLTLLIPAFALLFAPPVLPVWLLRSRTLPYHVLLDIHGFGGMLSLDTFSVPAHSTSELLRTLSMVAASKPTSWLSLRTDSLSHSASTWRP